MSNMDTTNTSVDPSEALFLIIHHLRHNTPCQEAAALLEAQALEHGLLPQRTDVDGRPQRANYTALQQLHREIHPHALLELLAQPLLTARQGAMPGAANVTTLLGTGTTMWGIMLAAFHSLVIYSTPPFSQVYYQPSPALCNTTSPTMRYVHSPTPQPYVPIPPCSQKSCCERRGWGGPGAPVHCTTHNNEQLHCVIIAQCGGIVRWCIVQYVWAGGI